MKSAGGATLATVANMKECERRGLKVSALSLNTFEQYSATPGDYWDHDASPLVDEEGEPMILVRTITSYLDALTLADVFQGEFSEQA
ncbi:MAG: hypothetical protein H0U59_11855 [Gemmatimonadaceae bacterium]|nr:hypothetical protein [Gemmatimonadaceae bacterium]